MAQHRYWNYEDDDSTNDLNHWLLGIIPAGLYAGFDVSAFSNNMTLSMVHTITGFTEVDINGTRTSKMGLVRTEQGTIVKEDATVQLVIAAGESQPRIDLIVMEHVYTVTEGGTGAVYKVIKGVAASNPVAPTPIFPNRQTIIGTLYIPANITALNATGVKWTKADIPGFAQDETIVRTRNTQDIFGRKKFSSTYLKIATASVINTTQLKLDDEANVFTLDFISNSYLDIDTLIPVFAAKGYSYTILTFQKLKLINIANLHLGAAEDEGAVFIEAGESFKLTDMTALSGGPVGSSPRYLLQRGGESKKDADTKYTGTQKWNKGLAALDNINETVSFTKSGNFFDLNVASGGPDISFLPILAPDYSGRIGAGSFIMLRINVTGIASLPVLKNLAVSSPAGYKPIVTQTGANVTLHTGDILILLEDESNWKLVNIIGTQYNPVTLMEAVTNAVNSLADVKMKSQAWLEGLEPNIILRGGLTTNVSGTTSGTLDISAGVAYIDGKYRTFPAYTGAFPVYLGRDLAQVNAEVAVWRTSPAEVGKEITYNPYTSQFIKFVIKRASMDIGDIKMSKVRSSDFDSEGIGRWGQLGFHLCNGYDSTVDMRGQVPAGLDDLAALTDTSWRTILNRFGNSFKTITRSMLPNVKLKMFGSSDPDTGNIADNANGTANWTSNDDYGNQDYNIKAANSNPVYGNTESINGNVTQTDIDVRQDTRVLAFIERIAIP